MKDKRYTVTVVRDKKNLQRTLNTFSSQYSYIAMTVSSEPAYQFYFFDTFTSSKCDHILYNEKLAEMALRDTDKLLEANMNMFEHKPYQTAIEATIKKFHTLGKLGDKIVERNVFFIKDKKSVLDFLHNELEKNIDKELSVRFVSKLYTTLKNRVLYPMLYTSDYKSSKNPRTKFAYTSIETTINQHYNFYHEHKWILEYREDFQLYRWQLEEEPNNPIVQEWNEFMSFLISNKVEKQLLDSIQFLGYYINIFVLDMFFVDDFSDYSKKILKFFKNGKFCFISKNNTLHGIMLKTYLDDIDHTEADNYRQIGKIHQAIYKYIPSDIQDDIAKTYLDLWYGRYKSVFDFSDPSRQTYTPSEYDEYYYAKYGYYPDEEENDDKDTEQPDNEETDDSYFPYINNPSTDEYPFEDTEEEKIEIPSNKQPENVPPPIDYEEDEIPF